MRGSPLVGADGADELEEPPEDGPILEYLWPQPASPVGFTIRGEEPVSDGGALDRLRRISERLAGSQRWQRAEATHFVLTAWSPPVRSVRVVHRAGQIPWNDRLHVVVDPDVAPAQVKAAYERARAGLNRGRRRALSPRHAGLVEFDAGREDEPWAERMAAWNAEHPGWGYSDAARFKLECERARARLVPEDPDAGGRDGFVHIPRLGTPPG